SQLVRGVEWESVCVLGAPGEVGAGFEQQLSRAPLTSGACVPKSLRNLVARRLFREQLVQTFEQAERARRPELVDPRASPDEQPRDVPAFVPHRVFDWCADRTVRRVDIGAAIDQDTRNFQVVVARGPMQWRFFGGPPRIRIGAGREQYARDFGTVREV